VSPRESHARQYASAAGAKPPPFHRPTKLTLFAPAHSAVAVLLEAYHYGDPPAARALTLPGLLDCAVPLLFSVAERDPRSFHQQAAGVVAAWQARHAVSSLAQWAVRSASHCPR
jgi:hypothetical protein